MSTKEQRKEWLRLADEEYVLPSYAVAAREAVPGLVREIYNLESQLENEGNNRDHYKQVFEESCTYVAELLRDTLHIDPKDEPADLWTLNKRIEHILKTIVRVTAELRHAYANLTSANNATDATRSLADGLIAPQIRALERLVKP